jgi:phospholipase/carboxylesterase
MNIKTLNYIEVKPLNKQKPKKLVLFLHGYGTNKNDLIHLASDFAELLPDAQFISVDAPESYEGGYENSYQWFSLEEFEHSIIQKRIEIAHKILNKFIDDTLERLDLKDKDLLLIGFSQGAMMSLYTGLQRANKLMGIVSFSGALAFDELSLREKVESKPKILLIHGTADERMPYLYFEEAKRLLAGAGIIFEAHSIQEMEHNIDEKALLKAKNFIIGLR